MSRQDELLEIESSQRQHFAVLEHELALAALKEAGVINEGS